MTNCLRFFVTQIITAPGMITMTIAATRMHRSLVDYASGFSDVYDTFNLLHLLSYSTRGYRFRVSAQENKKLPKISAVFSKTTRAQAALNSLDQIELTVHTAFEQHTTTQTNDHDSYNNTNERMGP